MLHVCFALQYQLLLEHINSKYTVPDSCMLENTTVAFPTIVGEMQLGACG